MSIYEPEEDSFMMSETLEKELPKFLNKNKNLKFLEIGIGSGINLKSALKAGVKRENIVGLDINPEAVSHCEKLGFNCIASDLFNSVKGKFNIIIFNPPYLPEDEDEPVESRRETTAGKKGNEIIIKFLKQAKIHLEKDGKIFLITSSLSEKINFEKLAYKSEEVATKNLFFEKLSLWILNIK